MNPIICIYKITSPSNKVYIGQTTNHKRRTTEYKQLKCKNQHKLYNSLVKYGFENHKVEIIHYCDVQNLNKLEKYYCDLFETFNNKNGLNIRDGGGANGAMSDEQKVKLSKLATGRKASPEAKLKMSISQKNRPHIKHTEETKKKLSLVKKGTQTRLGAKLSQETKDKIRESLKKAVEKNGCGFNKGIKTSCNTRN